MTLSTIDPATSALLVMDLQAAIVAMVPAEQDGVLERTAGLLAWARGAGARVLHVVTSFRAGYPELGPRDPLYAPMRASGRFLEGAAGTEIHPAVAPLPDEVVITKRRTSAFFATDLDVVLRAQGLATLVLAGIATSGVVLATARQAADADYRVVVAEDCCADRDPEVHRVIIDKVFARWTTVTKAERLLAPAPR